MSCCQQPRLGKRRASMTRGLSVIVHGRVCDLLETVDVALSSRKYITPKRSLQYRIDIVVTLFGEHPIILSTYFWQMTLRPSGKTPADLRPPQRWYLTMWYLHAHLPGLEVCAPCAEGMILQNRPSTETSRCSMAIPAARESSS